MTYKTTNNDHGDYSVLAMKNFSQHKAMDLRDQLIQQMASYCAETSMDLFSEYAFNIAGKFAQLPVDKQMYAKMVQIDRSIQLEGVHTVGVDVINEMRRLVA